MLLFPLQATAGEADEEGTATIDISLNLDITERDPIDFGIIGKPSEDSNTITLNWQNGQLNIEGDGDAFYVDGAQNGRYQVWGPEGEEVEITGLIEDFDAEGIDVEETHLEGESNSEIVELPGSGVYNARVGGVITIDADAETGVHTTDFHITATYP